MKAANSIRLFWRRISDGIAVQQLWSQFHAEARASYKLYSDEVEWKQQPGERRGKRFRRVVRGLFWAMMMKLSPARRVLLLIGLILLCFPGFSFTYRDAEFQMSNFAFFGGAALLVLLALELSDRVSMKRDLEIAREIQSWLMPASPPRVAGLDVAFANRPANTVAGDYYDVFFRPAANGAEPGSERLLIVVADVAGKSIPAALLMATLQASLRTLAAVPGPLTDLVRRVNEYACAQNPSGRRFTTAFVAELEPATGRLTYINAGHNWPVLRHTNGVIERLEAGGLPLGIRPGAPYECGSATMAEGDLLFIFTDGLVEAENDKEQEFGEERMFASLLNSAANSATQVLDGLMASVNAFVGLTRQHDDITCLVVRKL